MTLVDTFPERRAACRALGRRRVQHAKGNNMRHIQITLSVLVAALAGCATPQANPPAPEKFVASVTQYDHSEVNEAASAYVALYRQTIERSLSERRYQEDMAYKHLSAEACLDSRATRLLDKKITPEEKNALMLSSVSQGKLNAYRGLSKGYFTRVNGLEFLTCELAGLRVSSKDLKY
ncbi:MAG: hypothetical protein IV088_25960 [Hydrogenophaga sp.]|uniref:hypothetical protein n=1 Tax=Hydrogenophaga sp. TaxID=1904254 RepID=UPI0025BA171C|nr:hypothetical protein [Hydrogenophaga sp.]MBT9554303.1 hypothetical protein [Hydrogenophaga sp.]